MDEEKKADARIKNYKELARKKVPAELHRSLPTSFDIIGDIAVLKLGEELKQFQAEIGEAILGAYKSIKVVAIDSGVTGDLRRRSVEIIAGESRTTTSHKEYGITLEVDIARAYFSPRLASERWRIAQQVGSDECVVDAFAGVGPFSILAAKHRKPRKIIAIDINPAAFEFLEKNIRANKVGGTVSGICGDAREELPKIAQNEKISRIIMNLPWKSFEFLDAAMGAVSNGGYIHFYEISEKNDIEKRKEDIIGLAGRVGAGARISQSRVIKSYSPSQVNYVLDLLIEKVAR